MDRLANQWSVKDELIKLMDRCSKLESHCKDLEESLERKEESINKLKLITSQALAQNNNSMNQKRLNSLVLYGEEDKENFCQKLKEELKQLGNVEDSIQSVRRISKKNEKSGCSAYNIQIKNTRMRQKIIALATSSAQTGLHVVSTARTWTTRETRCQKYILGEIAKTLTKGGRTACVPRFATEAVMYIQEKSTEARVKYTYVQAIQRFAKELIKKEIIKRAFGMLEGFKKPFIETLLMLKMEE